MSGFRSNAHSIQLESMKHVYMQTKAALHQGRSPEHCLSGYRLSAFKVQSKTPYDRWKVHGLSSQEDTKYNCLSPYNSGKDPAQPKSLTDYGKGPEDVTCEHTDNEGENPRTQESIPHLGHHQLLGSGYSHDESSNMNTTELSQRTAFPIIRPMLKEKNSSGTSSPSMTNLKTQDVSRSCNDAKQSKPELSESANIKLFLEPVDSLHVEIQQLQARILNRIKASSNLKVITNICFMSL